MIKFKNSLIATFALIAAATTGTAYATTDLSAPIYKPEYKRQFDPFGISFNTGSFNQSYGRFKCTNNPVCRQAIIFIGNNSMAMSSIVNQGPRYRFSVPLSINDYLNVRNNDAPQEFPYVFKHISDPDFFYQSLTFAPFVNGHEMSYQDSLKAKQAIDAQLANLEKNAKLQIQKMNLGSSTNTMNEAFALASFDNSLNNVRRRKAVTEFMLSSPEAFNNYKNAFNKFYTVKFPFPYKNHQPVLKEGVLEGAKLTAYECQFMKSLEDFSELQTQNRFTCANK